MPDVDDSLLYSVPQDYKIDLLDQYDDHYLMKIIKYLHNEINNSVVPETGTSEQIEQLQEENRQLANQNKEQANQIQQFQEQVKELTKEVGIRKEINMNDQTEITRLRVLLRRAGIAVSTTAAEA